MIGSNSGYYADAPVVIMTKKGEEWDSENAIRIYPTRTVELSSDEAECEMNTWEYTFDPYADFSFSCKATISEDAKAQIMGFRNANCLSRHIRRMKRKKEQERRRRLKSGTG